MQFVLTDIVHVSSCLPTTFPMTAGVTAKVIYSGGADLDILPQHASKGKGLEFLLSEVSLSMIKRVFTQPSTVSACYLLMSAWCFQATLPT